ncbi:DUF4395 domain-containing protein [Pseudalkalibacillus sp. A8]|uniref:DUF4395 domain-containing protein n=1 Tax=Pseudalkalibacillus sp. A8 TaxID=3382641 RepID=UPI0038B48C27
MKDNTQTIPRPLVRANQWVILVSVLGTWFTGQEWLLWIPLLSGLCGLFFHYNPIMAVAKRFLRRPYSYYVLEDKQQQQFNQWIATILLTIAIVSHYFGWTEIAILSSAMVAIASFVAILGFCIGCYLRYKWSQHRFKRTQKTL